jgi:hypothetical protein
MSRRLALFINCSVFTLNLCIATAVSRADFSAHVDALKKTMPEEFASVEEPPFVVLSDQSEHEFALSVQTVHWTVKHLKKDFFAKDPVEIIDIWLFQDRTSYKRYAWQLFHDEPTTPYGYYSPQHRALLMNISTGSGTLVHEIVHPFMRGNFPACPTWFDEGLASLFEQSTERKGHIVGLVNWRLPGLQKAIRTKTILSFEKLTNLSPSEFYDGDDSPNYSQYYGQARYLCYYLQERGLLVKFYREFTANAAADPTGYATLQRVLGVDDMTAFQEKWEEFVLALKPAT